MRTTYYVPLFALLSLLAQSAVAQEFQVGPSVSKNGCQLGEAKEETLKLGILVSAQTGPCRGIFATIPVPIDWPEQRVEVVEEEKSPFVRSVRYRTVEGTVKQMLFDIPQLPPGAQAGALATVKVTRHALEAPKDTTIFKIPDRIDRDVRTYLGDSPFIESRSNQIVDVAKKLMRENETKGDWEKVEAIYDWVRENVEYKDGPLKGALAALRDGDGDCEELSSLFIAICRAAKIPARTVWVPGHCYPEFYLEDNEGEGHWFPCQAAGSRAFGEIAEFRPIMQKGDNFRVPERPRDRQRYVAEFLTGAGGQPTVQFIRETVDPAKANQNLNLNAN